MADPKVTTLGKQAKTALPEAIFTEPFHESLVHDAARADANARRRGTASTLGRGEVSMTGAKAWRQKGTGRARVGALSVGHRRGGGPSFGPKPRGYTVKVNRKARRKALRAALSVHADRDSVAVLDAAAYSEPSTKTAAEALAKWGARTPDAAPPGRRGGRRPKELSQHPGRHGPAGGCGGRRRRDRAPLADPHAGRHRSDRVALRRSDTRRVRPRRRRGRWERFLMEARSILIEPVVSEKSYALMADGKYTFRVDDRAHKTQIARAVEEVFDVTVLNVRTQSIRSKPKRRGLHSGKTRSWKKAIVKLAPGDRIELFEGAVAD